MYFDGYHYFLELANIHIFSFEKRKTIDVVYVQKYFSG